MVRLPFPKKGVHTPLFILLALVLSGCSLIGQGNEDGESAGVPMVFGHEAPLLGPATLMCTQECSDRGFCGTLDSGAEVVLMSTFSPTTQNYNLMVLDETAVTIADVRPMEAILQSTQQPLSVFYYLVNNPEFQQGWVAGWCVGQPAQQ